jgi:hypothetical protein
MAIRLPIGEMLLAWYAGGGYRQISKGAQPATQPEPASRRWFSLPLFENNVHRRHQQSETYHMGPYQLGGFEAARIFAASVNISLGS